MSLAGWWQRAEQLEQLHAETIAEHKAVRHEAHPGPNHAYLEEKFPERIPVTPETLATLPVALIRFYRERNITELAARCMLNDYSYTHVRRGGNKGVSPERKPEDVRTRTMGHYADLRKFLASRPR